MLFCENCITLAEGFFSFKDKIRCQFHFGPSIDSKSKNPFMPVHPKELAANGIQYPLLLGYTSREGIVLYMCMILFLFYFIRCEHMR